MCFKQRSGAVAVNSPQITTLEGDVEFCRMLRELLDEHSDVVTDLAEGFKECRKHIKVRGFPTQKRMKTAL